MCYEFSRKNPTKHKCNVEFNSTNNIRYICIAILKECKFSATYWTIDRCKIAEISNWINTFVNSPITSAEFTISLFIFIHDRISIHCL